MKIKISVMTRLALEELCENNECTIDELINALMSNTVREELSVQIKYNKTGQLPE